MPSSSPIPIKSSFTRAIDALCLSRDEIAQALDLTPALLDAYTDEKLPVPPMVQLELVDLLKAHEAMLGSAAGSLYDEAMFHLENSGLARSITPNDLPLPPLPPLPPLHPRGGGSAA